MPGLGRAVGLAEAVPTEHGDRRASSDGAVPRSGSQELERARGAAREPTRR